MDRTKWTYKKLGEECVQKRMILRASKQYAPDELINYIDISSIDNKQNIILSTTPYVFCDAPSRAQQIVEKGDILVSLVRPNLKNIAIVREDNYRLVASSGFCVIRAKEDISNNFIFYVIRGESFTNFLLKRVQGANYPAVREEDIKDYVIPVPPLSEQERIVSELDLLSGIIEKKKAQLKELDNLAQSVFYDMFGDPVTNEKGWEKEEMGKLCTITSSKRIFANEYCEQGVPFYRGKEITELSKGFPVSIELSISQDRYEEIKKEYGIPLVGDILITAVGTIGNIWVVSDDKPFYFKDGNIIWLKDINGFNSVFFRKLLSLQIEAYKHEIAQGCAYNALTIVNLKKMKVIMPSLSLQQQFAEKIEAIEKQKELIKQSIEETQTLFNSRMDYWFA